MAQTGRLLTFTHGGRAHYGASDGKGGVILLSDRFGVRWPSLLEAIAEGGLQSLLEAAGSKPADFTENDIRFEIPLARPEKLICIGVNFPDRNAEYKDGQEAPPNPSMFVRFPRSFTGHNRPLIRPRASHQLDYEGEIVLVIGKGGRHIPEAQALDHVAALSLCNEGTLRDWVRHAKFNVTQGKNFDSSGAIGPWLIPFIGEAQIADITLETRVNGEVRQKDRTSRMIFSFRKLINYISTFTTLAPGDMIVTGTPTGAGARFDPPIWLKPGDVIEVEAEGLGTLRNTVEDEAI